MTILTCLQPAVTPGDYLKCFNQIPLITTWSVVYVALILLSVVKLYALFRFSVGKSLLVTGFMGSLAGIGLFVAELLNPYYITISLSLLAIGVFLSILKT